MKLYFVTTNPHKRAEVQAVLQPYGHEVEQLDREYDELQDASLAEIAASGARSIARDVNAPVMTDDTGFYFEAYNDFPGILSKFVYQALGYHGLLKLLEEEDRSAYSMSVAAYCEPDGEPVTFEGFTKGSISKEVYDQDADVQPFERIFIPEGYEVTSSKLSREEKNKISHRGQAFRKLGEYLKKN